MSDFIEIPEHILNSPQLSNQEEDAAAQAKVQKIVGKAIWTAEDEEKFIQHINNDPKVLAFFKPYTEYNIQSFKDNYLQDRRHIIKMESMSLHQEFKYPPREEQESQEHFWLIQQKKLFDKQCLWRAKKIDIPQIKVSMDFKYWSVAIKYCPFIEPVQPDEVELLKRFLLEKGYELDIEGFNTYEFQDYATIKEEEFIPPFYEYWDLHKGTGYLIDLPDLRGPIETAYTDKVYEQINAEYAKKYPVDLNKEKKKILFTSDEAEFEHFINLTKDNHFKKVYHKHKKGEAIINETEDYDIADISDRAENIPMNYPLVTMYPSWRKNVAATISKYHHEVYANNMDRIYEMYCMEREMEIELDMDGDDARYIKSYQNISEIIRAQVLSGRKLAGEPEDWSFLQD